jgi:hypothetical protein
MLLRAGLFLELLNELGLIQLSTIPKGGPVNGSTRKQPVEGFSTLPTLMGRKLRKASQSKTAQSGLEHFASRRRR